MAKIQEAYHTIEETLSTLTGFYATHCKTIKQFTVDGAHQNHPPRLQLPLLLALSFSFFFALPTLSQLTDCFAELPLVTKRSLFRLFADASGRLHLHGFGKLLYASLKPRAGCLLTSSSNGECIFLTETSCKESYNVSQSMKVETTFFTYFESQN